MTPAKLPPCKVCSEKNAGKYRCPIDHIDYCSVVCFKQHKAEGCSTDASYVPPTPAVLQLEPAVKEHEDDNDDRPRKRLKELDWPPEPDPALWEDPLLRDDVKPLRGFEFEAIATSADVRRLLMKPELRAALNRLVQLPRRAQEASLRVLLGLPADPTSSTYRPEPHLRYATAVQTASVAAASARSGGGRGGRGGRGRGAGSHRGGGSGYGGRGRGIPEDRLLQSTPEEREDVVKFVEQVQGVLSAVRASRGEVIRT